MTRTIIAPLTVIGDHGVLYTANAADVTMTAADIANGNRAILGGGDQLLLVCRNTNVGAQTVTVVSSADEDFERTGDITTYSIGASEYAIFGPFGRTGWVQSDGYLWFTASSADVLIGVLKIV